jgi:hypothetical protein
VLQEPGLLEVVTDLASSAVQPAHDRPDRDPITSAAPPRNGRSPGGREAAHPGPDPPPPWANASTGARPGRAPRAPSTSSSESTCSRNRSSRVSFTTHTLQLTHPPWSSAGTDDPTARTSLGRAARRPGLPSRPATAGAPRGPRGIPPSAANAPGQRRSATPTRGHSRSRGTSPPVRSRSTSRVSAPCPAPPAAVRPEIAATVASGGRGRRHASTARAESCSTQWIAAG